MSEQAWHFCGETLRDGTPRARVGEWETYEGEVDMCRSGLHASTRLIDALKYAPGPILRLVEVKDVAARENDKLVCRRRKVLVEIDATAGLRGFARWFALQVVHLWDAPPVVVDYLRTGDESLEDSAGAAAGAAARDSAGAAARDAARAAARAAAGAGAWDSTRDAARAAAWATARAAAWEAARVDAWGAAWDAARATARAAAWGAQNEELERCVLEAMSAKEAGDECAESL